MPVLPRITLDPNVMGGEPCIRGLRVTVGTLVGLIAARLPKTKFCVSTRTLSLTISARRFPMPRGVLKELEVPLAVE